MKQVPGHDTTKLKAHGLSQKTSFLKTKIFFLVLILVVTFVTSFALGRYPIPVKDVISILASKFFPVEVTWERITESVVFTIRIPRIILAITVGAGLAVSGAAFQGIFRNPLVSSDILGVSAASGFGAALAIMLFHGGFWITGFALIFGLGGVFITYNLGRIHKTTPTVMLVLSGVVVSALFNAFISILKYFADPMDELPAITFWLMGSLSAANWDKLSFSLPIIITGTVVLSLLGWRINFLAMGEEEARSLGIRTERLKGIVIFFSTLMTATCVSVSGTIGWIGLLIPHIARWYVGPEHQKLLPASALIGGIYLLCVDNVSRTVSEVSVPLGIITAVIGAPFFAILLRRTKKEWAK